MNLASLRARTRQFIDDFAGDKHFDDARVDAAINDAQIEACTRSDLINDSVSIPMVDATRTYDLPAYFKVPTLVRYKYRVLRQNFALRKDREASNWRESFGFPREYLINRESRLITLDKAIETVSVDDVIIVDFVALPSVLMVNDTDEPMIKDNHLALCYWAVVLLLSDSEPDTQNPNKVAEFSMLFSQVFGFSIETRVLNQRANVRPLRCKAEFL